MLFGQGLLVATGIIILSIRISGHSPDFSLYLILELCAYAVLVYKLLWRDIHATAIKDIRTQRLIPTPVEAVETDSVISSILESMDSPSSQRSKDSLQEVLFPSPIRDSPSHKLPAAPLFRPVLGGFPKPVNRPSSPKRISELLKPAKLRQGRIATPRTAPQFDPESAPVKEMNAFEEAALKQLTEITKKVEEAVKVAQAQEREKAVVTPLPIVLEHSPSVIDLPVVPRNPDPVVIRPEIVEPEPQVKMELVEMGAMEKEEKSLDQPMAVENSGNGAFSAQPFVTPNPPPGGHLPQLVEETTARRTFQPLRLVHRAEEGRNVEMKPAPSQETYASRLSLLPTEAPHRSSSFFLDSSKSAAILPSSNQSLQPSTSPALLHLLEHISNKTSALKNLQVEMKEEAVKFAYSIYPGADTTLHSRFRAFQLIADPSVRVSPTLLYYLVDRMLVQTQNCLSSINGMAYANCLIHHITVMSQEWTSLEDIFLSELLASEPILSSVPQTEVLSSDTLLKYSSKDTLSIADSLLQTYNYAILFGFLMRKRLKVTIADAWALLASYLNSPVTSCKTPAAVAGLLRAVGFEMDREYQTQFIKLVNLIMNTYFPEVKLKFPQEEVAVYIRELAEMTRFGKFKDPMERERLT